MNFDAARRYRSHGSGLVNAESSFAVLGTGVIVEPGVMVFHPERIRIGSNVYIGHNTILKGYFDSDFVIGDDTWIGQGCFLHSAGGLTIGRAVGIGPGVQIITSAHRDDDSTQPVLFQPLVFKPVALGDGCDLGVGSIVLPGVTIGEGAVVGAGSVVTRDVPAYEVWAGNPARLTRRRSQ